MGNLEAAGTMLDEGRSFLRNTEVQQLLARDTRGFDVSADPRKISMPSYAKCARRAPAPKRWRLS